MAANPFFVDPTMGAEAIPAQLAGISSILSENRLRQQAMQEQKDAEAKALARQQAVQQAAVQAFESKDPDVMARTALEFPEVSEMLKVATGIQDEQKNRDALGFTRAFALADNASRPALYERRIQELQAQGRDPSDTIASYEDFKANPDAEARDVLSYWAGIDPKGYGVYSDERKAEQAAALAAQKLAQQESQFNRAEAGRNARSARNAAPGTNGKPTAGMQDFQYFQDLKKTDPAGAEAFGRERGFISKEGQELSGHLQKRLSTATDDAIAAERNVGKFVGLADEIERSDLSGGVFGGKWSEIIKDVTGEQDAVSNLRREYNAIKGSQVVSNLPPGAASDKDIELALGGFPTDNASKEQLSGFLRGLSKIQQYNADFNNFKAEYISDTGNERGMLKAWKERGSSPVSAASETAPQEVTTIEQFNALPSGAVYLEDGVQYRKP